MRKELEIVTYMLVFRVTQQQLSGSSSYWKSHHEQALIWNFQAALEALILNMSRKEFKPEETGEKLAQLF